MRKDNCYKLKKEIEELRRENAFLREELARTGSDTSVADSKSFFEYLFKTVKEHSFYKRFSTIRSYFFKFKLFSTAFRLLSFIVIAIETSAVLLVLVTVAALTLPPFILGCFLFFGTSALRFSQDRKQTLTEIANKKVIVLFPPKQYIFKKESFFYKNALDLTARGSAVIAVSPFIISPKGIFEKGRFFLNSHRETSGITVIRRQYFFHIQKRIFNSHTNKVIFIY